MKLIPLLFISLLLTSCGLSSSKADSPFSTTLPEESSLISVSLPLPVPSTPSGEPVTVAALAPENSLHKDTIVLSNGTEYRIYPFHGWDLQHWHCGDQVVFSRCDDLSYKIRLINLSTHDSISVNKI